LPVLQRRIAPSADLRAASKLFSLMRRFRPAVVHTHMAKAGTVGRLAALAYNRTVGRREPARIVHTYHGHVLEGYFGAAITKAFIGIERLLARSTDRLVAISPRIRDELLHQHGIGRVAQYRVVPLGFDLTGLARIADEDRRNARQTLQIPGEARVVTTVGRLTAIKAHRLWLDVARLVAAQHPHTVFLIAGDGELRSQLERAALELGVHNRVRFLGWRRDLAVVYGATDVFLLTSRNEGTPVALIESMAAGCAGVSTDVGGVRDVIASPDLGCLAPFGNAAELAQHVVNLIDDDQRRRRIGEAGRAFVLRAFGLDRLLNDVDALYHEVLT
jgi:glycosyltransferase involved in cell wall biosynthesis